MTAKIRFKCDGCDRLLSVDAEKAGRKIRCPGCQTVLSIPQADADTSAKPAGGKKSAATGPGAPVASGNGQTRSRQSEKPTGPRRRSTENSEESNQTPRRGKRSGASNPDDVWSQPLSSYSSPAIEEHEYEQFGIERRQPAVRESDEVSTEVSLAGPLVIFAIGLVIGLVSIGLAFASPKAGLYVSYAAIIVGALLSFWGHWQIRTLAFSESMITGYLFLWFFPYSIYFIFSRFSETKTAFFAEFLGNIVAIAGIIGMVLSNIQLEKAEASADMQPDRFQHGVFVATVSLNSQDGSPTRKPGVRWQFAV